MKILDLKPLAGGDYPDGLQRLDYVSDIDGLHDWATLLPGRRRELWIVALHGHGACGDQLYTRKDVRTIWLPEFLATGGGIITLNLRGNAWMCPSAAADLHAVMHYLRAEHGLEKTIFCSGSMGGTSNLIYGVLHPEDVNAIVARGAATDLASYYDWCLTQPLPILKEIAEAIKTAYGAAPDQAPDLYRRHSTLANHARLTVPVYFSHGGADAIIPVEQARRLAEEVRGRNNFAYYEVPGGDHDSPLHDKEGLGWVMERMG